MVCNVCFKKNRYTYATVYSSIFLKHTLVHEMREMCREFFEIRRIQGSGGVFVLLLDAWKQIFLTPKKI